MAGETNAEPVLSSATTSPPAPLGALDDRLDLIGRKQLIHGNPRDRAVANERHHGVAVPTEHQSRHVFDGNAEFPGDEASETRRVEHASHSDHAVLGKTGDLLEGVDHRVERVGDHDHIRVRRVISNSLSDLRHDLEVRGQQIVARHARLAGQARRDDHDVGAGDAFVAVRAADLRIRSHDRSALGHVEGLALGKSFDDVEDHDVTEFAVCNLRGEYAADISAADQSNLVTHGEFSVGLVPAGRAGRLEFFDVFDQHVAKPTARDQGGSLHLTLEIVGHALLLDCRFDGALDQLSCFFPAHVLEHHHT